jgi:hypothetical protein
LAAGSAVAALPWCGELVYDPFLGSGTTLAAAEVTERVCCGLELDPKYVDVVVQRWQQLSGKEAARPCRAKRGASRSRNVRPTRFLWYVVTGVAVVP